MLYGPEDYYQGNFLKGIKEFVRIAGIHGLESYFKNLKREDASYGDILSSNLPQMHCHGIVCYSSLLLFILTLGPYLSFCFLSYLFLIISLCLALYASGSACLLFLVCHLFMQFFEQNFLAFPFS